MEAVGSRKAHPSRESGRAQREDGEKCGGVRLSAQRGVRTCDEVQRLGAGRRRGRPRPQRLCRPRGRRHRLSQGDGAHRLRRRGQRRGGKRARRHARRGSDHPRREGTGGRGGGGTLSREPGHAAGEGEHLLSRALLPDVCPRRRGGTGHFARQSAGAGGHRPLH